MRIGIDARLWDETGVGRYIRNLVKELQLMDKKNDYVIFVRRADYQKVKLQITNPKFQIRIADICWHTIEEQLRFPQILNKENLDLMHFPYFSVPIRYNKPFVITIHDLILNHFPTGKASTLPLPLYQIKRLGYDFVLSAAVKNAKKIIVPLNAVRDDLVKTMNVSKNKIVVTYEGVDLSLRAERSNLSKELPAGEAGIASSQGLRNYKYFLYVGNAYPHKNLERLIDAFIEFRKDNKNIDLMLVGKDDYFYKKLKEEVNKENQGGIIFKQDVTDEELASLYKNALAFISASLMEGFGLPALEAMSSNCPVLVSDIPAFREVCADAAVYFDPNSREDITEKMKMVLDLTEKEKKQVLDRGEKRVSKFSWKIMSKQTLEIYESCISL